MNQGDLQTRYSVTPRVLIFVFHGEKILLLKGSEFKRLFPGCWNGVGGHVERGETIHEAALRELREETGLHLQKLSLVGILNVDVEEKKGVCVFIFRCHLPAGSLPPLTGSPEGAPAWINMDDVYHLELIPDLPEILPLVIHHREGDDPFFLYENSEGGV